MFNFKKIVSVILVAAFVFSTACFSFADDTVIEIHSYDDLLAISENPSASYKLMTDIDMGDYAKEWIPFAFTGSFDGNGHYLKGFIVKSSNETRTVFDANKKEYTAICAGLFSCLENAVIKNLLIYDMYVDIGNGMGISEGSYCEPVFAGLVAGYAYNSTVSNCSVYGTACISTSGHCFGLGGIIGFAGHGRIEDCVTDTTLVCIDTDKQDKDEQFMGGVYAFGYSDILNCNVHIDGYDSDHGYVHNGGMVGCFMYYDKIDVGKTQILNNRVSGRITFFEDNRDRRAYCEAYIGEHMSWDYGWSGNTQNFYRKEVKDYTTTLLPEFIWDESPIEKTDVMLISSHADDEQLFFAGLLPYYSQVEKLAVQVLYVTDHAESTGRQQERERGLWDVGIKTKPDSLRIYDDAATLNAVDTKAALKVLAAYKISEEKFIQMLHEKIMKYKPQVIVSHDVNGEYKHGMHILVNEIIRKCLEQHKDEYDFLKKVYFHLYDENPVEFSLIDQPFDELDGLTPFQVTQQKGFAAHKSQHWCWFYGWIYGEYKDITKASEIKKYSPLKYGLYYGDSSLDEHKNNLFEGLKSYQQQEIERIAEEKRIAEEAARKAEEERLAKIAEEERLARRRLFIVLLTVVLIIIFAAFAVVFIKRRKTND